MTQLLISVKSVEESLIARYAGVEIIDLKDPAVGALGALATHEVSQIVQQINRSALISATVGEGHESVEALVSDIKLYASLGVDVVKLGVSELFLHQHFFTEMLNLTMQGIKLVAVLFADKPINFSLLSELQKSGFYGAMLDTQAKHFSLLDVQSTVALNSFVGLCEKYSLISGLAGSLNKSHLPLLLDMHPTFIGLRGGVCEQNNRTSELSHSKVAEVRKLLLNYNNNTLKDDSEDISLQS
jgi:(5-formylfuran-3-yl)methyl phosphate synthase